jgi:hypothetical protein
MRWVEGGYFPSIEAGRIGRGAKLPPQFGHRPPRRVSTHWRQKVHSKVQIIASVASGGKSLLQHSQFGRSSSIVITSFRCRKDVGSATLPKFQCSLQWRDGLAIILMGRNAPVRVWG